VGFLLSTRQNITVSVFIIMMLLGVVISFIMQWWWGIVGLIVLGLLSIPVITGIKNKAEISIGSMIENFLTLFGIALAPLFFDEGSVAVTAAETFLTRHKFQFDDRFVGPAIYLAVVVGLFIFSYLLKRLLRDNTMMGKKTLDEKLFDNSFQKKRRSFCELMKSDLHKINRDTQYSDDSFVELDAVFTVTKGRKQRKSICELVPALLNNKKESAFLVLGEPGSGKSTALRKLARTLLDEVEKTNKIPLYINLKDWQEEKDIVQSITIKSISDCVKTQKAIPKASKKVIIKGKSE